MHEECANKEAAYLSSAQITERFMMLCREHRPSIICDVGTRDCLDAIAMKSASPSSLVIV
jgi:hypothetical protein